MSLPAYMDSGFSPSIEPALCEVYSIARKNHGQSPPRLFSKKPAAAS
jgi:hypothetical protein